MEEYEAGYMKKKSKWGKALFTCFCISLLFVVIYQVEEPRIESVVEALFIITGCTLSFFMWYAYPQLRAMYNENDGNTQVLYFKNAKATFASFAAPPETVEF